MILAPLFPASITAERVRVHEKAAVGIEGGVWLAGSGEDFQLNASVFRLPEHQSTIGNAERFRARVVRPVQRLWQRACGRNGGAQGAGIGGCKSKGGGFQTHLVFGNRRARILNAIPWSRNDGCFEISGIAQVDIPVKRPLVTTLRTCHRAGRAPGGVAAAIWIQNWQGRRGKAESNQLLRIPFRDWHPGFAAIVREHVIARSCVSVIAAGIHKTLPDCLRIRGIENPHVPVNTRQRSIMHTGRTHSRSCHPGRIRPQCQANQSCRRCGSHGTITNGHDRRSLHRNRSKRSGGGWTSVFSFFHLRAGRYVKRHVSARARGRARPGCGFQNESE